jgi:hypothetical protein
MSRIIRLANPIRTACQIRFMSSDSQQPGWGSGSGKGGGSGGSVRDAGGAFGKRQAAKEEEYFRKLSQQQLETLKSSLAEEIDYHKDQIEDHQEALERHKRKLEELKKLTEKTTEPK